MTIKEIYTLFDRIGCCTFATVNGAYPETRIAHFLTHDDEGLYFMTANTKPFYRQLKEGGTVSVCGLCANSAVKETAEGNLHFEAGYFVRLTGDVREVPMEKIKAKNDASFAYCIADQKRYPAMTTFVVYRAWGEVFDYDFEKEFRDHKLERFRFQYGDFPIPVPGLTITDACTGCGICAEVCTFSAIAPEGKRYRIEGNRCDECGNCVAYCPAGVILHKGGAWGSDR